MSRTSTLILLGVLTMLVPFSGLPAAFRTLLTVAFGIAILGIGIALRTQEVREAQSPAGNQTPEPAAPSMDVQAPPSSVSPI